MWLGVDVGGPQKRFDVAVVDHVRLVALEGRVDGSRMRALVDAYNPRVVAIDSPRSWAPPGASARSGELCLNHKVCGIRWTPEEIKAQTNPYYRWIIEGLRLYDSLEAGTNEIIEVFPTASWTRWIGKRKGTRAAWTRQGLSKLGLEDVPARTNQDQRDAIAAAITAREHEAGLTEHFGEIVVPRETQCPK